MFPARAGMSLERRVRPLGAVHVPRASGDEPRYSVMPEWVIGCSPRERG